MLTWAITCGHHAALAHVLATHPAASQALGTMRNVLSMAIATNSERIVELVCAHAGPVNPFTFVAAVRRGSLSIVDVLMRYLPKRTTDAEDNGETASMLDHLEALLRESDTSTQHLWHHAGTLLPHTLVCGHNQPLTILCAHHACLVHQRSAAGGYTSLMGHLAKLHQEHSQESYHRLLCSFESVRGYTGNHTRPSLPIVRVCVFSLCLPLPCRACRLIPFSAPECVPSKQSASV
jgi:hypothetical protein